MQDQRTPRADLIVTGQLRRGDGSWGPGEVWVSGERIVAVHDQLRPADGPGRQARRLDAGEAYVLPGAVDAHVHCLSHQGEGVRAATSSAAAGGVTTIVEMPFDSTGPINTRDRLLAKQDLVANEAAVDVALLGTLSPGGGWNEADVLADHGVVGFKVSLFLTDNFRFPRLDDYELTQTMKVVHETGRTLCTHAENNEIVTTLLRLQGEGRPTDPRSHGRSRPPVSESLGVLTALEIAAYQETALHVCHLSLRRSLDHVAWYQSQGVNVTVETCPHYLTFTEADVLRQRGRLKINPPIRSAEERDGVWSRLLSGAVSVVASDHAPWPTDFKDSERMLENHSGVPGVETLVSVTLGEALHRDPDLRHFGAVVDAMTIAPARRFGIDDRKGSLSPGKDADIMVFAPSSDARIDGDALHSNAGWSPYSGMAPGGVVTHTFSRGRLVWSSGAGLTAEPGRGRILARADG